MKPKDLYYYSLKELLSESKDGEWGADLPKENLVEMLVIRGADFEKIRYGNLTDIPIRYITEVIAKRKSLKPKDILIETAGGTKNQPTGRTVFLKESLFKEVDKLITCASFSRFLRVDVNIADPGYVFWFLQYLYQTGLMETYQVQHTGISRFQYTKFSQNIAIPLPCINKQQQISKILFNLDNKIELNRKMNATLEQMAQAIFKSWFVDFDPVKAKAAGREPEGMDAETAALFPSEFEQSELGMVPKGWEIGSFGQMFNFTMGQSPPGETYNENREGIVFYQGRTDFGFRYPTPRTYCFAPMRFAQEGETLLSVRAPVGDINMSMERCCIGRGLASIIHKSGSCSYTFYKMKYLEKELASFNGEGTVFGSISKTTLSEVKIKEPSKILIFVFEKLVSSIDKKIKTLSQEMINLVSLRDSLLPRLISGKLRIPDVEKQEENYL